MKITKATIQNYRSYQEDRVLFRKFSDNTILFGVFDGHGGEYTSNFLSNYTVRAFNKIRKDIPNIDGTLLLTKLFDVLNKKTNKNSSGSTASLVWLNMPLMTAYVAVIGDSPVFVKLATGDVWQSPEHNVRTNKNEAIAAENRGGWIRNGYLFNCQGSYNQGLQMSRALGDTDLNNVLDRNPEIFQLSINNDSWIFCGTDGVVDCGHADHNAATDLITEIDTNSKITAKFLVNRTNEKENLQKYGGDNATAILVRL